jgi:hypothetical protein
MNSLPSRLLALAVLAPGALPAAQSTELAKLAATSGEASFGRAVSVHGRTVLVGAPEDDRAVLDAGAVYVFERHPGSASAWNEITPLVASDASAHDRFGSGVAVHTDTAVVGAVPSVSKHGAAYVFERSPGGAFGEVAKLTATPPKKNDRFGSTVAVEGDTLVVGSYSGAFVFQRNQGGPGAWGQVKKLSPGSTAAQFGVAVAISGDRVLVGSRADAVFLFERHQGGPDNWSEVAALLGSDTIPGDGFGVSVALAGDTAVVGAYLDDHSGLIVPGSAYVFERNQGGPGAWGEVRKLVAADASHADRFGYSVALVHQRAAVGAYGDNHSGGRDVGSAYVFGRDHGGPGLFGQIDKLVPNQLSTGGQLGSSVDLFANTVVVGSYFAGRAHVFGVSAPPETYCTSGTSASGCRASLSVAGSASTSLASGFSVIAAGVEGTQAGLFLYGVGGRQANPWGNGTSYRCLAPPARRGALQPGGGSIGACDGSFTEDLNARWCASCPKPKHNPGAGGLVQAQLWYLDPLNTSNQSSSYSDAIEFYVEP